MQAKEIIQQSAVTLVEMIRTRSVSSQEVVSAFLERIKAVNPKLNAVVQMNEERSLLQAKEADEKLARGEAIGALHGLPITIKDVVDLPDFPSRYGSHLYDNYQATQENISVKRFKEAGAILLGLTNSPELMTAYEADNLIYGRTNNPYNLELSSGGSSGGEAAIIAAHGSPLGLGGDGGGSIRLPAHFCGIAGIKPTQGLVPRTGVTMPGSGPGCLLPFASNGPMAKTVDDLILGLSVISGADGQDLFSPPVELEPFNQIDISQLRVAYFTNNGIVKPQQEVIDTTLAAVEALRMMGAQVEEAKPDNIERTFELHWETFFTLCDAGVTVSQFLSELPYEKISPLRQQFERDAKQTKLSTTEMNQRFLDIAKFRAGVFQFLNRYDVLICPPCATVAKPHGRCLDEAKDFTYTMSFNNSGSPAVVVPFGQTEDGLPVGVQVVANLWKDYTALSVAKALEGCFSGCNQLKQQC